MINYFVTGGAGMIGSGLVIRLLKAGNRVTVFDNLSSGKIENLDEAKSFDGFKFIEGDIKNLKAITDSLIGSDFIFHLAANPDIKFLEGDPTDKDLKENTIGTFNVLEGARVNKIKKFVFSSSSAVYGEPNIFPTPEGYGPLEPISLYGASKLAGEGLITSYSHLFDIQAWIFRFANVVGDKSRKRGTTVLTDFIGKLKKNPKQLEILGNGKQKKSFLWVEDCLDGMLKVTENAKEKVNIVNLGNSDSITIDDLAKTVVDKMGLENVETTHTGGDRGWRGDSPQMLLDVTKAKKYGWIAKYSSREAIERSAEKLIEALNLS